MNLTRTAVRSAVAAVASMVFVAGLALPGHAETGPSTHPDVRIENNTQETTETVEDSARHLAIGTQPPCTPAVTPKFWVEREGDDWVQYYSLAASRPYGCTGGISVQVVIYDTTRYPTTTYRVGSDSASGTDYAEAVARVVLPSPRLVGEVSTTGYVSRGDTLAACHYAEYAVSGPVSDEQPRHVPLFESRSCS